MKEYISRFYAEGLATTFYLKPKQIAENKIKNKKTYIIVSIIIKIIYTVLSILFALFMFLYNWPL